MGHYASEMGYFREDRYNYAAVNAAGFGHWSPIGFDNDLRECPKCYALVKGERALDHLAAMHPEGDEA